jgi:hypothetical protein
MREAMSRLTAIGAVLVVLAGCTAPEPGGSVGTTNTSVFFLDQGQCFNALDQEVVDEVEVVACGRGHQYELFAIFDHSAGSSAAYPGDAAVSSEAEEGCGSRFEDFVGRNYQDSDLYIFLLTPSADTWADGDREILCSLYLPDEELTESMENSGR